MYWFNNACVVDRYTNLTYIVDQMFPTGQDGDALLDDFSQFVYWREPIGDVNLSLPPVKT